MGVDPKVLTVDGYDMQFGTNVLGKTTLRITRNVLTIRTSQVTGISPNFLCPLSCVAERVRQMNVPGSLLPPLRAHTSHRCAGVLSMTFLRGRKCLP